MAGAAAVSESELQISKSQCATVASFLVGRAAAAPFSALDKYKGGLTDGDGSDSTRQVYQQLGPQVAWMEVDFIGYVDW